LKSGKTGFHKTQKSIFLINAQKGSNMLAAMFGKKEGNANAFTASTSSGSEVRLSIVAEGTTVRGDVETAGNLRIDGKIIGNIVSTASVAIGKGGSVEGNITAATIKISGKVQGNIDASGHLVLDATATVCGEIKVKSLTVEEGAIVNGKITMETHSTSDLNAFSTNKEYAQ
jgi:cytoskeletal protein CcmA (bactofilin family)